MEIDWHKRLQLPRVAPTVSTSSTYWDEVRKAWPRSWLLTQGLDVGPMVHRRPTRDENFMHIAQVVAERATCPRASIGAVIVSAENRILSTGYNGAPPGEPHCADVGCDVVDDHCQRAIHAEVNAVVFARGSLAGSRLYVYGRGVCRECAKVLKAAGVSW